MIKHEHFMRMALQVAELGRGQTPPNPMVGAVVVKDGQVIGQGAHLKAGTPHAEVHALRMAGEAARGATVYVTLEPCSHHGRTPPCTDALIAAGVARVVIAAGDPNPAVNGEGVRRLWTAGIDVVTGVLAAEARQQNEMYFTWRQTGRPFVLWKCAATLDGYIAASTGHSQHVSGELARAQVQELRREYPAIAVGVGTILADNPRLTVRLSGRDSEQPLRVVFDSRLRMPATAACLRESGTTRVYTTDQTLAEEPGRVRQLIDAGADVRAVPAGADGRVDLAAALQDLGGTGIIGVLLEGGGTLAGSMLARRLLDKVVYYLTPQLLGGGIPALTGRHTAAVTEAVRLTNVAVVPVGADFRIEGYLDYAGIPEE